ncbi:MAG: thioredoxin domain-containing protein [Chloroflexi bacterium]|nr:thioredoxin domain-containing protein [Chloroflexota bacterium]
MPNHLANETSPYLLQHKDNPVDWYAWGPEALAKAQANDMPIMLSIGYSACHWCHVMEHESFEDPQTAEIMNALFVNIKVDREERPDLDSIYMQAVQSLTGHGGWPMTVFLTPDGKPFYGGTYFPNEPRHGMPSFTEVLKSVADAYHNRRGEVLQGAGQLAQQLQVGVARQASGEMLSGAVLQQAAQRLASNFDWDNGGFGTAPKFPQAMSLEFLMRSHKRQGDARLLQMVEHTLTHMARGGIYDHLGGGFHRYSVDAHWLVPHFEKMLYDNALLAGVYLHGWQLTGNAFYRRVCEETCDFVLRDMRDRRGGFYSTLDADSEGEEGKFYVWMPAEVEALLGKDDARLFNAYYDVTAKGNFEGHNILNVPVEMAEVVRQQGVDESRLRDAVERSKRILWQARERRVHPGRDEKVLTAWNGMMLKSLAEAAAAFGRKDYLDAAVANGNFLFSSLRKDGRVLRTWKDGQAKLLGYLEDYANLIDGLIALHAATFDRRWLDEARGLADDMVRLFRDASTGLFYDTGSDHEQLVVRPRDIFDNATPSGGAVAADVLLRLGVLLGDQRYQPIAAESLRCVAPFMTNYPNGFAHWLGALDFYLSKPLEIAIAGAPTDSATRSLAEVVFKRYLPNKVVAGWNPSSGSSGSKGIPLLEGRTLIDGKPAAYVCENYACQLPATTAEELGRQLG